MRNGAEVLLDKAKFGEAADEMVSMFDREVFDYIIASDMGGMALASVVAYRLKKGIVSPCMDAPAGKYILIGFDMADGKLVKKQVDKIKECKGTVIKMGFFKEDAARAIRKSLFRGIPVESVNLL